jgi:hypothetical protein
MEYGFNPRCKVRVFSRPRAQLKLLCGRYIDEVPHILDVVAISAEHVK